MTKHKVFISYHHKNDENYKIEFEKRFGNIFINKSVQDGEYDDDLCDEYIKRLIRQDKISDCSVVVVLIGAETYKRKHVDWEIYAGISGKAGGRSGLIGVVLPTYYSSAENSHLAQNKYEPTTIPPRLQDNKKTGYAELYTWEYICQVNQSNRYNIETVIENAFKRKNDQNIKTDNSREQFKNNRA